MEYKSTIYKSRFLYLCKTILLLLNFKSLSRGDRVIPANKSSSSKVSSIGSSLNSVKSPPSFPISAAVSFESQSMFIICSTYLPPNSTRYYLGSSVR